MPAASATPPARQDRRKERTRAALMTAAQRLLATGEDSQASIQTITDLADVGFGSFYNHFTSKEELFEAAGAATLDEYFAWLDENLPDGVDPAGRLQESVRLTGRLAHEQPTIAAVLGRRLTLLDREDDPRRRRIEQDVRAAMSIDATSPGTLESDILVTASLGAILAVLRRTLTLTEDETARAAEVLAGAVLRIATSVRETDSERASYAPRVPR